MRDEDKSKEQLIAELAEHRQKIIELERTLQTQNLNVTGKYHISQLIDIPFLQQLFDSFFEITGIMHAFLDVDTNIMTRTGWSDICLNFHRICPETECRCKQSDRFIADHLQDGSYIRYQCLNGLVDYATPIIVEGQHLATIFTGQLFNEPPDEEYFRQQAREFGFDEVAYIEALHKVSIIPEHRIKPVMEFYSKLGQILATIGLERLRRLEAAENRFLKALQCIPDPVTITTFGADAYVDMNDAWVETTGYEKHEAIGRTSIELGFHVDLEARSLIIKTVQAKGYARNIEISFRMKSGETRHFISSFETITIGGTPHLLGVHKDITERKRMERRLIESEEKFSKVFQYNPVIMAIVSLADYKYIDVNEAFCNIKGYQLEEIVGRSIVDSNPPHSHATITAMDKIRQKLMEVGIVRNAEINFATKSGEQRVGLLSAVLLNIDGQERILEVIRDITELRQMELEMTRLDRLNVVGEMAASLGHEIRNPMTTVRGYLQLLREKEACHQETGCFDLMIEELDRANSIITEFLSLAKNKIVELKPTSLNKIISKLFPLLKAKAGSQDQHIKQRLGDLPDIFLDTKEIQQLILNLVNNGLEAMPSGGTVTISTLIEKDNVVLAVRDEGHGIDSDLLHKLGTPFLTTKEQGVGLGLAVCYRIAARHNAKIEIVTSSGGSTFLVRFPNPTFS